jgi:tetratricopeptide (TPR) repeat protein
MRSFATRAVEEIEKGPEMTLLTGADWFRLARLHDFLRQQSEAEAAYRRSVSAFRATPAANPAYQGLALAQVADFDYGNLHYQAAAVGYDEALKLLPETDQVKPYRHGLTLLAVGRYEEAIERLKIVRDPETVTEAQYATDIARKAEVAKPLSKEDVDGIEIAKMPLKALEDRVREAAARLQESRAKYSYKSGDPLSAELRERQSRFIALLIERLMRQGKIQDFCLSEGMAELVRR